MEKVVVNKIIPFSSVDGPGNRTAVFLQGCNINCRYCHNPETRGMCTNCGECVAKCPTGALSIENKKVKYDSSKCVSCDTCIHVCRHDSSPRTKVMDAYEVYDMIKKQIPFIRGTLYKLIAKNPQMQAGRLIPADFFNIGFYSFSLY